MEKLPPVIALLASGWPMVPLTVKTPPVLVPPPPAILYQSMENCWANRTDGASSSAVRSSHFQFPIPNGDTVFAARSVGGCAEFKLASVFVRADSVFKVF